MSDPGPLWIPLQASRARRRCVLACAGANAALALLMLTAWARDPDGGRLAAAGACALAACVGAWAARRSGAPAGIYLARAGEHDVQDRRLASVRLARRPLAPGAALTLVKARAEHIGASRIVLRAGARRAVVWRDATDADTYRRLAVRLRWAADVR